MFRKSKSFFLAVFIFLGMFSLNSIAFADVRQLPVKYSFDSSGSLVRKLVADFGTQKKVVQVQRLPLSNDKMLLTAVFPIDTEEVFLLQMFDSKSYSIYKARLRDKEREDVIILGLGPVSGKKVQLKEIVILSEDESGEVVAMSVDGFEAMTVLNSPMHLDGKRNIVFPTEVGTKKAIISWDAVEKKFTMNRGGKSTSSVSSSTKLNNTIDANDTSENDDLRDDSVFDEDGEEW